MGYRTVTASEFFDVKKIDVRGTVHASKNDIEKIVTVQTEKLGVWNADLKEIKEKVERLDFVKTAAVSRVLPDGVRVNVVERVPKAVVRLNGGDFWADEEGVVIALVEKTAERPPFYLSGWDETKTEQAQKENQVRIKTYQKMLEEWREFDLAKRVESIDLKDLRTPRATIKDSGETVTIVLAKENFGKKLKDGLEKIAGKGKEVVFIDVSGTQPFYGFSEKSQN